RQQVRKLVRQRLRRWRRLTRLVTSRGALLARMRPPARRGTSGQPSPAPSRIVSFRAPPATVSWSPPMPVNLTVAKPADLHPIPGVRVGVAMAGVRKANRKDLVAFVLDAGTLVAGVFTQNRFCAAPVQVCREHLATGDHDGQEGIRALV